MKWCVFITQCFTSLFGAWNDKNRWLFEFSIFSLERFNLANVYAQTVGVFLYDGVNNKSESSIVPLFILLYYGLSKNMSIENYTFNMKLNCYLHSSLIFRLDKNILNVSKWDELFDLVSFLLRNILHVFQQSIFWLE